ncbi:uncharacterized protein B0H18DRAFT_1115308 [Fomitopsis serialis]|uniref:uncharacterized protein n=1 Tax=Fomitopsis serialis TaxID=139415 RepID=UPI0020080491|nr:uncharacterized protein B0H18DRAFT_1115308 [Neoantrodia serialis]KAH9933295.1 hypothetical protein B0H18DRAFT_1115308 [Neoantrodia serialis]
MASSHALDDESEADDPGFATLPAHLRRRIDSAFDEAVSSGLEPSRKRRRLAPHSDSINVAPSSEPGGFVLDEAEPGGFLPEGDDQPGGYLPDGNDQPGGFLVDTPMHEDSASNHAASTQHIGTTDSEEDAKIPLSHIPHALQLLDLQPDDEDVLAVFRHAASGWEDKTHARSRQDISDEQFVSRKDWRAVCATLLGGDEDDADTGTTRDRRLPAADAYDEGGELTPLESSGSEDEYEASEPEVDSSDAGDDASDDEYQEGGFIATRSKGKQPVSARTSKRASHSARTSSPVTSDDDTSKTRNRPLTTRQRLECRRTFALFFPDVPDSQLDKQRIMIKDITRVAKLLKEKITAEETLEMLEMFASSADKSMSLQDFERMMMSAKLA